MMAKKAKKAFTIVELVIVIAVIAILMAVLIPTFVSLVKKANVSSDSQLVRNLNTILTAEGVTEGKNPTMHDALADAEANGYIIDKISPTTAGYDIVWDSESDRFVLLDENGNSVYKDDATTVADDKLYQLWKIYNARTEAIPTHGTQTYSIYLGEGATWTDEAYKVNVGLDVGEQILSALTYERSATGTQSVSIRTNGGTLTVNAPADTIVHYNGIDKVIIKDVDGNSYYENGVVAVSMEVQKGHVVIEPNASVNELIVSETAPADTKVDLQANSTVATLVVDSATAAVDVNASAAVKDVVASESNANVTIPESVGAVKEPKVEAENATDLQNALNAGKKYIVITDDFSITSPIEVKKSTTIDGGNHTITADGATRMLWIDANNVALSIKNLTLDSNDTSERGIQVNPNYTGYNVLLENVKSINNTYYAINLCGSTSGRLLAINCEISGWSALNTWGSGHDIKFMNSTLIGTNKQSVNKWNNYATICLAADTTETTNDYSSYNSVTLVDCTISAIETNDNIQAIVSFNGGTIGATGNRMITMGCTFNVARYLILAGGSGNSWTDDGETIWSN